MADEKDLELEKKKEQDKLTEEASALRDEFPIVKPEEIQETVANDGADKDEPKANEAGKEDREQTREGISQEDKKQTVEEEKTTEDQNEQTDENVEEDEASNNKEQAELDSKDPAKLDTENENDLPPVTDNVDNNTEQENDPQLPTIEELRQENEALKFEKDTRAQIDYFKGLVAEQEAQYQDFLGQLENTVKDEFNKYGIPLDCDLDELKEVDPAKYQIYNNIIEYAKRVNDAVKQKLNEPIKEANEKIIFRTASNEMRKYQMTKDEFDLAADTFIGIINTVGLDDLGDDLKAKVELSVARGKMLANINKQTKEVPKEVISKVEEPKKQVTVEDKNIDDFKNGITPGISQKEDTVNDNNVLDLYKSLDGDERIEFFQEHQELIMRKIAEKGGMGYSDNTRKW